MAVPPSAVFRQAFRASSVGGQRLVGSEILELAGVTEVNVDHEVLDISPLAIDILPNPIYVFIGLFQLSQDLLKKFIHRPPNEAPEK
jgi:hypothetical protein